MRERDFGFCSGHSSRMRPPMIRCFASAISQTLWATSLPSDGSCSPSNGRLEKHMATVKRRPASGKPHVLRAERQSESGDRFDSRGDLAEPC